MPIIAPIPRDERRLMQKAIHKTHDKNYARRGTFEHICTLLRELVKHAPADFGYQRSR